MTRIAKRTTAIVFGLLLGVSAWAGLETVTHISDLNAAWPLGSDLASTSDDHLRNIKTALKNDFPNMNGTGGSVTAPIFAPPNDTNTGLYFPSADDLALATGGTKRFEIGSAGAVTIAAPTAGTALTVSGVSTSPALQLSLTNSNQPDLVIDNSAANGSFLQLNSSATAYGYLGSAAQLTSGAATDVTLRGQGNLFLATNGGNNRFEITTTGDIGYGAASQSVLSLGSSIATFQLNGGSTSRTGGLRFRSSDASLDMALYGDTAGGGLNLGTITNHQVSLVQNNTIRFAITTTPALQGYGPTAAGLVDMTPDTGTFTATYTGFTVNPTCTAKWSRVGNLVTLVFCVATATSSGTTFTMTGLPAAIQPATTQRIALGVGSAEDNGSIWNVCSATVTAASGTVTFSNATLSGAWTASGTKGFGNAASITYILN